METMILVAGLAFAGLAGIAAAFYFSMRPDGSRARAVPGSRVRDAVQTDDSRRPASRSRTSRPPTGGPDRSASPARSARGARAESGRALDHTGPSGSSTVIDFTGPQRVLEDPEPAVTGRRARHEPDDPSATPRSRRRATWRKGSDVDEELWPVEAFGGVSDEQFWDDLAADKPLATTARAAQPDTAAKRQPPNTGPGTHPQPRLGPDDRTAIQPAHPTQPARPAQSGPQPSAASPVATQPYPAATQPAAIATQPVRATHQPAGSRARTRTSADEDPLTSPAYSLRPKGSVDGRAYPPSRRSADPTRGQYEAAAGQETQAFSLADAQAAGGGYPDGVPPFRQAGRPSHSGNGGRGRPDAGRPDPLRSDGYRSDPLRSDRLRPDSLRPGDGYGGTAPNSPYTPNSPYAAHPYSQQPYGEPAQSMDTPPYGERYGYGNPAHQGGPAGDPRRANGGWSPGPASGNGGGGSWGSRPAYPPVNAPRGPYDPQGYDRRLPSLVRTSGPPAGFCVTRAFA